MDTKYLDIIRKYWPNKSVVRVVNDGSRYEELVWNELDDTPIPTKAELDAAIAADIKGGQISRVFSGPLVGAVGTTIIPSGNNVPLITEGTQLMACAVQPTNVNTKYTFITNLIADCAVKNRDVVLALFRNGVCVHTKAITITTTGDAANVSITFTDQPQTLSTVMYSLRVGASATTTWYINTTSSGKKFGGTAASSFTIFEHE